MCTSLVICGACEDCCIISYCIMIGTDSYLNVQRTIENIGTIACLTHVTEHIFIVFMCIKTQVKFELLAHFINNPIITKE